MKKQGFKKIPWSLRERLYELSGNELKVWLHAYLYTGKDDQSTLDNPRISRETGLHMDTVIVCKASLRRKDWLVKVGEVSFGTHGGRPMPVLHAVIPEPQERNSSAIEKVPKAWKKPPMQGRKSSVKPKAENFQSFVDTCLGSGQKPSLPVDTKEVGTESNLASERHEALETTEKRTPTGKHGQEAWDSLSSQEKQACYQLGERLAVRLEDDAWDILDAFQLWSTLTEMEADTYPYGKDVQHLLKIFTSPRWKGAEKTIHELAFRLASASGNENSLREQFLRVRTGRLRTEAKLVE